MQSSNTKAGPSRPKRGRFNYYTDAELLEILENSDEECDFEFRESDDGWPVAESESDSDDDRDNEIPVQDNTNLSEGRQCLLLIKLIFFKFNFNLYS